MRRSLLSAFAIATTACGAGAPAAPSSPVQMPTVASSSSVTAPVVGAREPHVDREFLRAYAATRGFRMGAPQRATPTPDGKSVLFLRSGGRDPKQALYETDVASGATREVLTADALAKGPESLSAAERARRERMRVTARGFASFDLSDDGALVLLPLSGRLFVLERATGKTRELATGASAAIDPHFSADGKRVFYVRGNDLYAVGTSGEPEVAVTRGGTETRTHGAAEFIAQEELGRTRGFWLSPDGASVVYEEADTSKVEVLSIPDLAHPEKEPDKSAYPRPGKANADVRFGIVSTRGGATRWIDWDNKRFPYVAVVKWPKVGPVTMFVLDRLQHDAALLAVDVATGKTTTLVAEHDDAWVNIDASVPRWMPDGKSFLWSSERSGAWQLEMRDAKGAPLRELTKKELGYDEVLDVDPKKQIAIVSASDEPTESRVYAVPLAGGDAKLIAGGPGETAYASFGQGHDVLVLAKASTTSMTKWLARTVDGAASHEIPSSIESPGELPKLELTRVGEGEMRVAIVRPRSFVAGRRYAVIDAAYGGPHVLVVGAAVSRYLHAQWIADATDAIVVFIDARGTPHRGRAWERAIYDKLGSVPIDGHVEALRALGAKYPEMDASRVGVYGWSFGGYFAALAVLTHPDVYKVGVAGAPGVEWRDYDTAYTERYLALPESNAAAYDAASVLTHAKKPLAPGEVARPLLIVHGTADDNVYFMHSLKLVDALERARRPFEFMPLAGTTHMLVEPSLNETVWTRAAEFLRASLRRSTASAGSADPAGTSSDRSRPSRPHLRRCLCSGVCRPDRSSRTCRWPRRRARRRRSRRR